MFGIAKRENKGLLAGLYEFPSIAGHFNKKELEEKLEEDGIVVKKCSHWERESTFFHILNGI